MILERDAQSIDDSRSIFHAFESLRSQAESAALCDFIGSRSFRVASSSFVCLLVYEKFLFRYSIVYQIQRPQYSPSPSRLVRCAERPEAKCTRETSKNREVLCRDVIAFGQVRQGGPFHIESSERHTLDLSSFCCFFCVRRYATKHRLLVLDHSS